MDVLLRLIASTVIDVCLTMHQDIDICQYVGRSA